MRRLALALVAVALAGGLAGDARAERECDGLDVCIRVPGPWVVLPAPGASGLTTVTYRLSCPRGSIAGGLDAELGHPAISVAFLGTMGSPVNPGISTSRDVDFVALYTPRTRRPALFRPLLGCIPTSGGGGRSTTAVSPERPPVRRVKSVRVRPGGATAAHTCRAGERLVGSSHALAFRTRRPPSAAALLAVRASSRLRGARVVARASRGVAVPAGVRVQLQVHAICARGG